MSTNFYFTDAKTETPTHIGKASNSGGDYGMSTFFGGRFSTLAELREHLTTADGVVIVDEYETEHSTDEFVAAHIDGFRSSHARYNIGFLHGSRIDVGTTSDEGTDYWIDTASGALFNRGEFF